MQQGPEEQQSVVQRLNQMEEEQARSELMKCSGSELWVNRMLEQRPFSSDEQLYEHGREVWVNLTREDWLEGFASHPKIGDVESLQKKFASTADWASGEQSGVVGAAQETIEELAQRNDEYEQRFGYIFIVCATGKSAEEMLEILKNRLPNDPEDEILIARDEHYKITEIRLGKI